MPKFATERRVAHSAEDMFALVADVESYPQFVPLCESLTVRKRLSEDGRDVLIADMAVGYKAIRETVTTRVTLDRAAMTVRSEYLEGPFRHLDSHWRFVPERKGACRIDFSIDYEFRSRLLAVLMGTMFDRAFRKFAEAFEARADRVFGRPAAG